MRTLQPTHLITVVITALALALAGCTSAGDAKRVDGRVKGDDGGTMAPDSPQPGASGRPTPTSSAKLDAFLARLPHFSPTPPATPIGIPAGPVAPIFKRLPTRQPVAFLTIDDGFIQLPDDITLMRAAHIPFSLFLIANVAGQNPAFFKQLQDAGGVVEDHTMTHPEMKGKPYGFQRQQICDAKTSLEHAFTTNIRLFRPPFGDYDQTTLRAVHDCGLRAAFYWSETVNNGTVFYQTSLHQIQAGDIILMHFRPAFLADVIAALTAIHNAGLTPALLESYIS